MGFQNGIFAFTAAVLGGIGSIRGAVVGAFIIGLIKTLAGQYMPGGTQYDYVWIFVVLILVLVFRPQGLFGEPRGCAHEHRRHAAPRPALAALAALGAVRPPLGGVLLHRRRAAAVGHVRPQRRHRTRTRRRCSSSTRRSPSPGSGWHLAAASGIAAIAVDRCSRSRRRAGSLRALGHRHSSPSRHQRRVHRVEGGGLGAITAVGRRRRVRRHRRADRRCAAIVVGAAAAASSRCRTSGRCKSPHRCVVAGAAGRRSRLCCCWSPRC